MSFDRVKLIEKAIEARNNAYSPYSNFKVGAAILLKNGDYLFGCNVENASYGLTNCAERTVLFNLISGGYNKEDVVAMAIVGSTKEPISPCGSCRQVMNELLLDDCPIVLANLEKEYIEYCNKELLPYSFKEECLK